MRSSIKIRNLHVKNEVIFVQLYRDFTLQLVVHVWCLASKKLPPIGCPCLVFSKEKNFLQLDVHVWCSTRKKTSICCCSLFDGGLSHVLFHKFNFNLILLCDWSQLHDTLNKLGYSYVFNFTYSAFFS